MIETHIRPHIQPLFDRVVYFLHRAHITPNTITGLALFFGLVASITLACGHPYAALYLLILSGTADVLDGSLARLYGLQSPVGAYMDLISDRLVEGSFIYACAIAYPQHMHAYFIFFIALLFHFATFAAAGALFENKGKKSMHYDVCIIERAEAFAFFIAMLIFDEQIYVLLMCLNTGMLLSACARSYRIIKC